MSPLLDGCVGVLGDVVVDFFGDHGDIDAAGADDLDANVAVSGALGEHPEVNRLVHADPVGLEPPSGSTHLAGYAGWSNLKIHRQNVITAFDNLNLFLLSAKAH